MISLDPSSVPALSVRRTAAHVAVVIAVALAMLPFLARPAAAADVSAESQILHLMNQERSARGLAPLGSRSDFTPVARNWTDRMANENNLRHNPNLTAEAPSDWTRVGENIGFADSVQQLHDLWMGSNGHRANILGDFNAVGIGVTLRNGRYWATVDFMLGSPDRVESASGTCGSNDNPAANPSSQAANGYYVLGSDGGIFTYGSAVFHGSTPQLGINVPAVLMAVTPSTNGYWVLGADGGIFSFGDAKFQGSLPGVGVRNTAIDLKSTRTGNGYWILGADGGIFSFGDAQFHGSLPGVGVRTRAVRLVPTPTGNGYWILGADGGIFSFGDAKFHGSLPGVGVRNTGVTMASTPTGGGYWILGADGGIFSFGDAQFRGSVPGIGLCQPVQGVQLSPTMTGGGYYIVGAAGRVFAFGDAPSYGDPSGLGIVARDVAAVRR
ncbi:MAG: CAP domain-containing protein [Acidimicrobiales bacterium]